jgi:hypothetical protein
MAKAQATVEELVGMIERGELELPEMQRGYVWPATRVRDLLDSLYRDYPSGTILLWETDEVVPTRDFAVATDRSPYLTKRFLLDGQQRLTSLASVIRGKPVEVRGGQRTREIEILFNLEHPDNLSEVLEVDEDNLDDVDDDAQEDADAGPDELQRRLDQLTFVVATNKLARLPQWVKVSEVFKTDSDFEFLERAGVTELRDPLAQKYSARLQRLRTIRKYEYRMDILERSLDYNEVAEIFVRVNSKGTKLRSSDLALARITAKWRNSLEAFEEFRQKCAVEHDFPLDLGVHLRSMIVHATGQSRFKTVGSLPIERLQESWSEHKKAFDYALNFLRSNCGISSPALLSSPLLIVALGFYASKHDYNVDGETATTLRRWARLANAKGRYSRGSSETTLDQDLVVIRDGGTPADLIEKLRLQVGVLNITTEELDGKNQRSALFKTMFMAFSELGAEDWTSSLKIDVTRSAGQHEVEFHHIFPQALVKNRYSKAVVNDIANLAFIDGRSNRRLSARPPKEYIAEIVKKRGSEPFDRQVIPTDLSTLEIEKFEAFLSERRTRIAAELNRFLEQ